MLSQISHPFSPPWHLTMLPLWIRKRKLVSHAHGHLTILPLLLTSLRMCLRHSSRVARLVPPALFSSLSGGSAPRTPWLHPNNLLTAHYQSKSISVYSSYVHYFTLYTIIYIIVRCCHYIH